MEMESLSPPCQLEFNCKLFTCYAEHGVSASGSSAIGNGHGDTGKRVKLDDREAVSTSKNGSKKAKGYKGSWKSKRSAKKYAKPANDESDRQLFLEFEWISGDNKDILHQVVQYFKNKTHNLKF